MITRATPSWLYSFPRLRPPVVRFLRKLGIRLVSPMSGLLWTKDPKRLLIYEVCELADEQGIENLSKMQQAVVRAWSGMGVIGNGGLRYFFEGSWEIRELANAFRTLELPEAAQACDAAADLFPGGVPPRDCGRRSDILDGMARDAFRSLDDALFAIGDDRFEAAIMKLMRDNLGDFRQFGLTTDHVP